MARAYLLDEDEGTKRITTVCLQHGGLSEIEYMLTSVIDIFYSVKIEKINEIIKKVNILVRLANQELNK